MLHALVGKEEKGEERRKCHMAWGSQKSLKPPEPNTRATSPAPQGSHTTTQLDTHNTHKTLWRQHREAAGRDILTEKGTEVSRCSQERLFLAAAPSPSNVP